MLQPSDSHTAFLPALAQTCDKVAVMQMKRKQPVFTCGGGALANNDPHQGSTLLQHFQPLAEDLGMTAQEQVSCLLEALSI